MCDYWISTEVPGTETRQSVEAALREMLVNRPVDLLIETSGSFFDNREVKPDLRTWMLQRFGELSLRCVIVETRTDILGDQSLESCVEMVRPAKLVVEFGVESLDPWVLKHCINKDTRPGSVLQALQQVQNKGAAATANVLLGAPFLSLAEQIVDSSRTLRGVLGMGFDTAVLFPTNVKHYTLTGWLHDQGLYSAPSLWALIDVLRGLAPELLTRIDISWHRPRPDYHPGYATKYLGPDTCLACYPQVAVILDQWRSSADRSALLTELSEIRCSCRDEHEACKRSPVEPLTQRLRVQQRQIVAELLDGAQGLDYLDTIPEHSIWGN
jgi:radical SAM enzyme (TIGR01210 family)